MFGKLAIGFTRDRLGSSPHQPGVGEEIIVAGYRNRRRLLSMGRIVIAASMLLAEVLAADPAPIGMSDVKYIDPEFEPDGNRIVFQDSKARAWVGELDPETGQCITATCLDVLVASDVLTGVDPRYFFNGPEWGISAAGTALYLTKFDDAGIPQAWWVNPDGSGLTQLTFEPGGVWAGVASNAWFAPLVRVIASSGTVNDLIPGIWFDETDGVLQPLPGLTLQSGGGRFVLNTARYAIYPYRESGKYSQLAILDMELQTIRVITNTPGQKSQAWGLLLDGVLHAATQRDLEEIEIYRSGSMPWQKVATLTPPVP
ncbi:MAG: hypothetical protein HKP57_05985, partial [Halobacteria archaeon]|nr:hypothetical protein [Halobacteria archaeon]